MDREFDPDDEDRFFAVRDDLLERFERWLDARGRSGELRMGAELLLTFKWGYLDGHPGRWRTADLDEVLLELYPRKVMADLDMAQLMIEAVARLLEFLDDQHLLATSSDPLPKLLARLEVLRAPFLDAVGDPSTRGPAASLVEAMRADGIDLDDAAAVGGWIEAFNAGTFEDRDRILGPAMPPVSATSHGRGRLRPVTLAPSDVLEEAARTAPAMVRLARFVEYVTTPRKLTGTGNLKLADAHQLVELLDLDDRLDETIGDRTFKTTSSAQLPTLDLTFRWARSAGLIKVRKGEVSATKAGQRLDRDVLATTERALRGLLELGVLTHRFREDTYGFGWYAADVDDEVWGWLLDLYEHDHLDIEELAGLMWEVLLGRFALDDVPADKLAIHRDLVRHGVRRILGRLEELGIVEVSGVEQKPTLVGSEDAGGVITLTGLGVWAVQRRASAEFDAPVVGMLADDSAADLLRKAADLAEDAARAEVEVWVARRSPGEAADELVAALPEVDDVGVGLAFGALLQLGEAAVDAVRTLRDDARLGSYAMVWLVDAQAPDAGDLEVDDTEQVALLHAVLDLRGQSAVIGWLPLALGVGADTGPDALAAAVGELWRDRSDRAVEVLDAVASEHPDKRVAKAARKALFKLRSARS